MRFIMKNYKKYIFDLDYTLLIPDWSKEDDYFKKTIPVEEQKEFFKHKQDILNKYEINRKDLGELIIEIHKKKPSYGYHRINAIIKREIGWIVSDNLVHEVCKILKIKLNDKTEKLKANKPYTIEDNCLKTELSAGETIELSNCI